MTDKSPSELERDAERLRAHIDETAEQLREKMSPGQLIDEVVHYFKNGDTGQMLVNLKHQARDNPLALALVGGGLAWLMSGSGTPAARPATRPAPRSAHATGTGVSGAGVRTSGATASPGDVAHSARTSMTDGAKRMGAAVGDASAGAGHAASHAVHAAGDAADAAGDYLRDRLHEASDYVHDGAEQIGTAASEIGGKARSTFLDALEREPLVIGALGLAVGAAIGAMLPPSRVEERYLGATGAKAREGVQSALSEGAARARHVAEEVTAAARKQADREGFPRDGGSLAEKAASVAQATGKEMRSAVRHSLADAESGVDAATDRLTPRKKPG